MSSEHMSLEELMEYVTTLENSKLKTNEQADYALYKSSVLSRHERGEPFESLYMELKNFLENL